MEASYWICCFSCWKGRYLNDAHTHTAFLSGAEHGGEMRWIRARPEVGSLLAAFGHTCSAGHSFYSLRYINLQLTTCG